MHKGIAETKQNWSDSLRKKEDFFFFLFRLKNQKNLVWILIFQKKKKKKKICKLNIFIQINVVVQSESALNRQKKK